MQHRTRITMTTLRSKWRRSELRQWWRSDTVDKVRFYIICGAVIVLTYIKLTSPQMPAIM